MPKIKKRPGSQRRLRKCGISGTMAAEVRHQIKFKE